MTKKTVIVLTGPMAAGKSPVTSFFEEHGYSSLSLSDVVREKHGKGEEETNRAELQDFGDTYRAQYGADIFAREVGKQIDASSEQCFVVDGARNPAELHFFHNTYEAVIIGITISEEQQFERMQKRDRPSDPQTRPAFEKVRERELGKGEPPEGQQVAASLDEADITIENTGDKEQLVARLQAFVQERGLPL